MPSIIEQAIQSFGKSKRLKQLDPKQAISSAKKALLLLETGRVDNDNRRKNYRAACLLLGDLLYKQGDREEAIKYYLKVIKICEHYNANGLYDFEVELDLSIAYGCLGAIHLDTKQDEKTLDCFQKSMQSAENTNQTNPDHADVKKNLAFAFKNFGDFYFTLDQDKALVYYRRMSEICKASIEIYPDDFDTRKMLFLCLGRLGHIYTKKDLDMASEFFDEIFNIAKEIAAKIPDDLEVQMYLAEAHNYDGNIFYYQGHNEKALEQYKLAFTTFEKLSKKYPYDLSVLAPLSYTYTNLGDVHFKCERYEDAFNCYENARKIHGDIVRDDPDNLNAQLDFSYCYINLGEVYFETGFEEKAIRHCEDAFEIIKPIMDIRPKDFDVWEYAIDYYDLCFRIYQTTNPKCSSQSLEKMLEKTIALYSEMPWNLNAIEWFDYLSEYLGEVFERDKSFALSGWLKLMPYCSDIVSKTICEDAARLRYFLNKSDDTDKIVRFLKNAGDKALQSLFKENCYCENINDLDHLMGLYGWALRAPVLKPVPGLEAKFRAYLKDRPWLWSFIDADYLDESQISKVQKISRQLKTALKRKLDINEKFIVLLRFTKERAQMLEMRDVKWLYENLQRNLNNQGGCEQRKKIYDDDIFWAEALQDWYVREIIQLSKKRTLTAGRIIFDIPHQIGCDGSSDPFSSFCMYAEESLSQYLRHGFLHKFLEQENVPGVSSECRRALLDVFRLWVCDQPMEDVKKDNTFENKFKNLKKNNRPVFANLKHLFLNNIRELFKKRMNRNVKPLLPEHPIGSSNQTKTKNFYDTLLEVHLNNWINEGQDRFDDMDFYVFWEYIKSRYPKLVFVENHQQTKHVMKSTIMPKNQIIPLMENVFGVVLNNILQHATSLSSYRCEVYFLRQRDIITFKIRNPISDNQVKECSSVAEKVKKMSVGSNQLKEEGGTGFPKLINTLGKDPSSSNLNLECFNCQNKDWFCVTINFLRNKHWAANF